MDDFYADAYGGREMNEANCPGHKRDQHTYWCLEAQCTVLRNALEEARAGRDSWLATAARAQAQVRKLREALAGFTDVSEASGCDECRICKACRKAARAALAEWEAQRR